jgi:hypothetical protein
MNYESASVPTEERNASGELDRVVKGILVRGPLRGDVASGGGEEWIAKRDTLMEVEPEKKYETHHSE